MPVIGIMSVNTEIISKINKHIDGLVAINKKLLMENANLKNDISTLKANISQKEEQLNKLKKEHEVLSIAKSLSGDGESNKEAKLKINELVREIDKCISLLHN